MDGLIQVRIVHEGMRFPLRLHGHTVITFHVSSVFPKNAVGKMMPIVVYISWLKSAKTQLLTL